jgi:hypothetical protein
MNRSISTPKPTSVLLVDDPSYGVLAALRYQDHAIQTSPAIFQMVSLGTWVNRGILDSSPLVMPPETTPSESALALLLEGHAAPALRSVGAARPELVHRGPELIHHTRSHDELQLHRDWTGMAVVPGHLRQRDRDAHWPLT